jgi:hypothetical protein
LIVPFIVFAIVAVSFVRRSNFTPNHLLYCFAVAFARGFFSPAFAAGDVLAAAAAGRGVGEAGRFAGSAPVGIAEAAGFGAV